MILRVVPYYAALLALLFVALSLRVIRSRRANKIAIGVSDNDELARRVRVHANFAEYVPFALLLLAMAELRGAPAVLLHPLCICLLAGRISHAWGVSRATEDYRFRVGGMVATFAAIVGAALLLMLGGMGTGRLPA